ncbi:hypothetical protein DENSPDRAFT_320939 [Dentipellis sp. KUC8613]|nr:hypothetical protein DENSPDRAFT_320939 [Dentipellis sp. KUC8613]
MMAVRVIAVELDTPRSMESHKYSSMWKTGLALDDVECAHSHAPLILLPGGSMVKINPQDRDVHSPRPVTDIA